jgi:hypothetical protein
MQTINRIFLAVLVGILRHIAPIHRSGISEFDIHGRAAQMLLRT